MGGGKYLCIYICKEKKTNLENDPAEREMAKNRSINKLMCSILHKRGFLLYGGRCWNEQVQIQLGQNSPPVYGHQDHTQLQLPGQAHAPPRDPGAWVPPLWKTAKEADGLHFGTGPKPDERQRAEQPTTSEVRTRQCWRKLLRMPKGETCTNAQFLSWSSFQQQRPCAGLSVLRLQDQTREVPWRSGLCDPSGEAGSL